MIFLKSNIKNKRGYWQLFYSLMLSLVAVSCTGQNSGKENNKGMAFESLLRMKGAIVSGYVIDSESKGVIASVNRNYRMTPASLSKIFTSSAALIQLGADYRFKTKIGFSNSKVINGVLKGDVIITGGGDPTLGSKYFASTDPDTVFSKILTSIKQSGVTSVSGELIIVSDYFSLPRYPSLRLWEDMSNYYGAPPTGLSFMDNTFTVILKSPQQIGSLCKVTAIIPACDIEIDCRVIASPSQKDSAYI
jgi:D-alanyl-D-alanine carboxypeptidase/D-alanyl-D-alanine-endopeptidase (penicillin-binding protein 4)